MDAVGTGVVAMVYSEWCGVWYDDGRVVVVVIMMETLEVVLGDIIERDEVLVVMVILDVYRISKIYQLEVLIFFFFDHPICLDFRVPRGEIYHTLSVQIMHFLVTDCVPPDPQFLHCL